MSFKLLESGIIPDNAVQSTFKAQQMPPLTLFVNNVGFAPKGIFNHHNLRIYIQIWRDQARICTSAKLWKAKVRNMSNIEDGRVDLKR